MQLLSWKSRFGKSLTASSICRSTTASCQAGANSVLGKSLVFLQLSVPHYHPSPLPAQLPQAVLISGLQTGGGGGGEASKY
jgi:hypothetical protein